MNNIKIGNDVFKTHGENLKLLYMVEKPNKEDLKKEIADPVGDPHPPAPKHLLKEPLVISGGTLGFHRIMFEK